MRVLGKRHSRREFDTHLDDLASRDAEIVPLEIDALIPACCARATCRTKLLATMTAATSAIRVAFM
jgi:hypothetical protein